MESPDIQGKLIAKKFSFVNRGFLLAWRNIWRNGRRTLITTGAVAFACLVLSFMIAFQQSTYKTAIEASTSIFDGHLQVQRSGYHEDPQSYLALEGIDRLQDQLRGIPEITDQSVRLNGFALLSSEDRTYGVQVIGVEPDHEPNLSTIPGTVRTGRYLLPSDTFQVVIGNSLAQNLHVQIGDEL
ncbi:MAG: ABC transporter permease, partial [Bdellovibrionales bacterium]|nr:ABC transporter permease [Bdellovibrionales bacterium]